MKRLLAILILLCGTPSLFSVFAETGAAVTNAVAAEPYPPTSKPPFVPPNPADVMHRQSYTNEAGVITRLVYVKKEIITYLPPSNTVMKVIYKDKLTHEPLMTVQVTTPRQEAYVAWEIAEE